jgi:hypothetical protein
MPSETDRLVHGTRTTTAAPSRPRAVKRPDASERSPDGRPPRGLAVAGRAFASVIREKCTSYFAEALPRCRRPHISAKPVTGPKPLQNGGFADQVPTSAPHRLVSPLISGLAVRPSSLLVLQVSLAKSLHGALPPPSSRGHLEGCDLAHHSGLPDSHLPCFGRSSPPCRPPQPKRTCWDATLSGGGSALQGHIRREGADLGDHGSTSSTSAATAPSAARAAVGASESSGGPRRSVRPVAASFARPRNAGARPRAALPPARTARRPLPESSPPWPSTPTSCSAV